MKALFLNGPRDVSIKNTEIPDFKDGEVLLKVMACGVCGSDIHSYFGKNTLIKYPAIPGHELSGIIQESKSQLFKKGDRVVVDPNIVCNKCVYCKSGRRNFCTDLKSIGNNIPGGFSEYVSVPDSQ
jgi:L-iditol 2-dehydrogenase